MITRKTYKFRKSDIIEVNEYHDGRYGSPGEKRAAKENRTEEQMRKVNAKNKARRCRHKLLEYINPSDFFVTWTYEVKNRPKDMNEALVHFQKAIRKVRDEYKARGYTLYWFRNIEKGTKGAWHIHLVVNKIDGAEGILRKAWTYGGIYISEIGMNEKIYDEDFTKLSNYLTKDEHTTEKNKDGTSAKPRIKEANYNTSRNMPLKKPDVDKLFRWKKEVKPKKGYVITKIHEGINPITGYKYRRYTMIRIRKRGAPEGGRGS